MDTAEAPKGEMHYLNSMLDAIGNTQLMRFNRIASDVPPLVLAKMEMFNPGGSVKDRIGPAMIEPADAARASPTQQRSTCRARRETVASPCPRSHPQEAP